MHRQSSLRIGHCARQNQMSESPNDEIGAFGAIDRRPCRGRIANMTPIKAFINNSWRSSKYLFRSRSESTNTIDNYNISYTLIVTPIVDAYRARIESVACGHRQVLVYAPRMHISARRTCSHWRLARIHFTSMHFMHECANSCRGLTAQSERATTSRTPRVTPTTVRIGPDPFSPCDAHSGATTKQRKSDTATEQKNRWNLYKNVA